jgi:hypothetical protein
MVRIGCDLGVFKTLAGSDQALSVDKLAEPSGADPLLMSRILRYLSSNRLVVEASQDHFAGNNTTRALADPRIEGAMYHASVPPDVLCGYMDMIIADFRKVSTSVPQHIKPSLSTYKKPSIRPARVVSVHGTRARILISTSSHGPSSIPTSSGTSSSL